MNLNIGDKAIITTDSWFYAPNGLSYRAVYGTIRAVRSDAETLGIKTNARSTNWYVEIGNMTVAGCQVHYAMRCDDAPPERVLDQRYNDGEVKQFARQSEIYNADASA